MLALPQGVNILALTLELISFITISRDVRKLLSNTLFSFIMSSMFLIVVYTASVSCLQCVRNSPEDDETIVQCEDNPEREFVESETDEQDQLEYYCFGVWEQSTGLDDVTVMKRAGCLASSRQARTHWACAERECLAITTQNIIYCCCNTSVCNNQYRYNKTTTTASAAATTTTDTKEHKIQTWIEVIAIVSILGVVVFLFKQTCWKHSSSEGKEENKSLNSNI